MQGRSENSFSEDFWEGFFGVIPFWALLIILVLIRAKLRTPAPAPETVDPVTPIRRATRAKHHRQRVVTQRVEPTNVPIRPIPSTHPATPVEAVAVDAHAATRASHVDNQRPKQVIQKKRSQQKNLSLCILLIEKNQKSQSL